MKNSARLQLVLGLLVLSLTIQGASYAQVNVTTYHNDNARTGQNTQESALTKTNVGYSTFGKLFSVPVDGYVYAQPLVLSNVSIGGGTHNVVYVATENNSLYAFDANNGTLYWQQNPGAAPIPNKDVCSMTDNIVPHIGITGTPVIDPVTKTIYLVTSTKESNGYYQRLHALDASTHAEKFGGPVVIAASYQGATFDAIRQLNRPGLLLVSGHVVVAFGQHCDSESYGWVLSYNAANLALEGAYNTNPTVIQGSVWMGGAGVASDPTGNLYFAVGNGVFDGISNFGDSIIRLGLPSGGVLPIKDSFTPSDQQHLLMNDLDLGSGGVLVLPDLTSGAHPHLLVQAGKEGTIYLVDRTNMGTYCGSSCTNRVVQELKGSLVGGDSRNIVGVWGAPAYWNGNVYFGSGTKDIGNVADSMKAYSFNSGGTGLLSFIRTSQTPQQFTWPAPTPSVSSNGTTNGIVWAYDNAGVLHAYDATNLATEIYNSGMVAWQLRLRRV